MKQYIGISRDHSGSMRSIAPAAARDFNSNILSIQQAARENSLDTIVSVVKCGVGWRASVEREIVNSNVQVLSPIPERAYVADGSATPLWDSVGELIDILSAVPDAADPKVSFLVMVITDGAENSSVKWNSQSLSNKIKQLQDSDRWTFVFRVPRGHAKHLMRFGIPEGNILEWDQTQRGIEQSTTVTTQAFTDYFKNRSAGVSSTKSFYADLKSMKVEDVAATLVDISNKVTIYPVSKNDAGSEIRAFIESKKSTYEKGCAFYQLSKSEKVQESKEICIVDKKKGTIYSGKSARQLLGLPINGEVRLRPGDMGDFQVYVQSTSVNRKLVGDTMVLYIEESAR